MCLPDGEMRTFFGTRESTNASGVTWLGLAVAIAAEDREISC